MNLMLTEMNQWNADDKKIWVKDNAGLGHLMLYNTPESLSEHLPLNDGNAQLTITADARIDNREELYGLLGINTHAERSMPDSSIILLCYKRYGTNCVKYLIGDFAFAIWDERNQKLFCARDQIGVKPFFYYHDDFFAFATEKKGLLCLPGVDKTINKTYFYNYLINATVSDRSATLYKRIFRLAAAHTLIYSADDNNITINNYWALDVETELILPNRQDYYDGLKSHFETAVKCRLRTLYPVGAELSGGMDSSSIVGVASRILRSSGKNVATFTNGHNDQSRAFTAENNLSEERYAQAVIDFNHIVDYTFITEPISDDRLLIVDQLLAINDGIEMANLGWKLPIKKAAMNQGIKTLLSGLAGDEMATYRGEHYFLDYLDHKQYLKYFMAKSRYPFYKLKPILGTKIEFILHKAKNALNSNNINSIIPIPLHYKWTRNDSSWNDVYFKERYKSYRHLLRHRFQKPQIALRMEIESVMGLRAGLECRYPMSDIRLVQFCLSMPNEIKYEGSSLSRHAWRKAVGDYLPTEILQRDTKTGLMIPYRKDPSTFIAQRKAISTQLLHLSEKHPKAFRKIKMANKANNSALKTLFILRWIENNFENI